MGRRRPRADRWRIGGPAGRAAATCCARSQGRPASSAPSAAQSASRWRRGHTWACGLRSRACCCARGMTLRLRPRRGATRSEPRRAPSNRGVDACASERQGCLYGREREQQRSERASGGCLRLCVVWAQIAELTATGVVGGDHTRNHHLSRRRPSYLRSDQPAPSFLPPIPFLHLGTRGPSRR